MNTYPIPYGNNTFDVFIPIYFNSTVVKKLHLQPYILFFHLLELVFTVLSLCLNTMLLCVLLKSSRFHTNLMRLYMMMLINLQLVPITRMVLILYQYGVVGIYKTPLLDLPLLIASFIRIYLMAYGACILPITAIERFCATIWMVDYEHRPRTVISKLLITGTLITSSVATGVGLIVVCIDVVTTFLVALPLYITLSSTCAVLIYYMNEFNKNTLKELVSGHNPNKYGPSKRFQLEENIAAYNLIRNINLSSASMNCIDASIGTAGFLVFTPGTTPSIFLLAIFDVVIALYPVVVDINLILTIDDWKDKFMVLMRKMCFRKEIERRSVRVQPKTSHSTNEYFDYYKGMW